MLAKPYHPARRSVENDPHLFGQFRECPLLGLPEVLVLPLQLHVPGGHPQATEHQNLARRHRASAHCLAAFQFLPEQVNDRLDLVLGSVTVESELLAEQVEAYKTVLHRYRLAC